MGIIATIFTLAFHTGNLCKAGLVLMMLDLVSRHCDLVAPIACDWCMSASIMMLLWFTYVVVGATIKSTIDESFRTRLLNMFLKLIETDLCLGAVIGAPEHSLVQDWRHDKVKVTLLSKLIVARIASVLAIRVTRRFILTAVNTSQSPARLALTRIVSKHSTAHASHWRERGIVARVQLE